jgi:CRISPR-associated protein Csb1
MSEQLTRFDGWLKDDGPAAIVFREFLMPVEGNDGVIFPPTFAAGDGFKGGYNVDEFPDGSNVCILDTVGSQANRIEPLFATDDFKSLIPQITIKAGQKQVNLLEAGHRAGDAIVRCTELQQKLQAAFKALLMGDALPLAKLAPTSLVFGVWDSRDTQAKAPRLIASTIRAFNVRRLTRSAQYVPAVDYVQEKLLEEPEDLKTEEGRIKTKHPFAQRGFTHVPATGTHGGVIAAGCIRRDATLHLAALRMLRAKNGADATLNLQRYLLGLALIALAYQPSSYLRQGCNLVRKPETSREIKLVYRNGQHEGVDIDLDEAKKFASDATEKFGVEQPENATFEFDPEKAKSNLPESGDTTKKGRGRSKK